MTIDTIETVIEVIIESQAAGTPVLTVWEYENSMNQRTMFAVFHVGTYCDIYTSPGVRNPVLIWKDGKFSGKYAYLNEENDE